jgi:2-polyprenyl-3-methyl-5-hydroxy-6-metoxy-1,4-benzoquinol methylase
VPKIYPVAKTELQTHYGSPTTEALLRQIHTDRYHQIARLTQALARRESDLELARSNACRAAESSTVSLRDIAAGAAKRLLDMLRRRVPGAAKRLLRSVQAVKPQNDPPLALGHDRSDGASRSDVANEPAGLAVTAPAAKNTDRNLIQDVVGRFDVTPEFVRAYLARQAVDGAAYPDWDSFLASRSSLGQVYANFAMSTTMRGRHAVALVSQQEAERINRNVQRKYLDVGCGYGGFLRAFAEDGWHVTGIEVSPQLAKYSRLNTSDVAQASVIEANFLRYPIDSLGSFDCITCNDVIEHVGDAAEALRRLGTLVAPGGMLMMEIPNKDYIGFVAKDGHFQLFGINCLRRDDAATYHAAMTGAPNYREHMGEFYQLPFYVENLAQSGLAVKVLPNQRSHRLADVPALLVELQQAFEEWEDGPARGIDDNLAALVTAEIEKYRLTLIRDLVAAMDAVDTGAFGQRYLNDFWTLIATRG